jgi:hypothetical protein
MCNRPRRRRAVNIRCAKLDLPEPIYHTQPGQSMQRFCRKVISAILPMVDIRKLIRHRSRRQAEHKAPLRVLTAFLSVVCNHSDG